MASRMLVTGHKESGVTFTLECNQRLEAICVWVTPLKLIDRGFILCLQAAWAMIVRAARRRLQLGNRKHGVQHLDFGATGETVVWDNTDTDGGMEQHQPAET